MLSKHSCFARKPLDNNKISPAADAHTRLMAIIEEIEFNKAYNDWRRFSASRTGSLLPGLLVDPTFQEAATDAEATPPPLPTALMAGSAPYPQAASAGSPSISQKHGPAEHPSSHKQKIKKQRRHGSRALQRRRQKWRRSRFRSRTDVQDRYVPDTVFIEKSSPVDLMELSGLKPSTPHSSKPKEQSARIDQVPAPAAKKKKKKLLADPKRIAGPKALKRAFKPVFATVTLTTGSLQGCLGRSTNLSKVEVAQLTQHVNSAVSTVNSSKHIVYKLIEIRILQPLLETGLDQAEDGPGESFLEKILDSDWAERFVQNILSLVLRNFTVPQGCPPASDTSKDAVAEAISTFNEFKKTLCPGSKALNSTDLALSNIVAELAPKFCLDLKLHCKRMPETLRIKLSKLSIDCDGLPEIYQDDTNAGDDAEMIKELLIGDRDAIKEARNRQQTTYGKRTTTVASQWRSYRYALNNYIRTDGHQLQILAYDLIKPCQPQNHKEFLSRIEKLYPTRQHLIDAFGDDLDSVIVVGIDPREDALTAAHKKYFELEPLIHWIYASRDWKLAVHEHSMAKISETDLAVAGVLRMVGEAYVSFSSAALGYKAALVDEYLTSTMCPTCVVKNRATRLAKPSMRTCACVECTRWIHRGGVGAHNIALIGEGQYLKSLGRPEPLAKPPKLYR
ncbi:hypothetical protein EC957_012231 [Mortierella hygrophila]|uniref:Uncharacterized protein n=1 Tax=Mortierella hygrophila TaxID=979708 RepID=A0A9P6F7K6_9FUNG|nr:hypothetical protein EC957_012231 [Mortierella hygrophila]